MIALEAGAPGLHKKLFNTFQWNSAYKLEIVEGYIYPFGHINPLTVNIFIINCPLVG